MWLVQDFQNIAGLYRYQLFTINALKVRYLLHLRFHDKNTEQLLLISQISMTRTHSTVNDDVALKNIAEFCRSIYAAVKNYIR